MTLHCYVGSRLFCSHNVGCYAVVQTAVGRSQVFNGYSAPWFTTTLPAGKGIPTLLQVTVGWGKPSAWQDTWKVVCCTGAACGCGTLVNTGRPEIEKKNAESHIQITLDYAGISESHHWENRKYWKLPYKKQEQLILLISFVNLSSLPITIFHWCCITNILHFIFAAELCTTKCVLPGGEGALHYETLMGTFRWMGSHFHDWIDYHGVAFSIELLE